MRKKLTIALYPVQHISDATNISVSTLIRFRRGVPASKLTIDKLQAWSHQSRTYIKLLNISYRKEN